MQPILLNVYAFDAKKDFTFSFTFGGNQPLKNRLIIRDNVTNDVVYDQTVTTMQLKHTLPANSIANRTTQYNAQVQTFDSDNVPSELSNKIVFYCFDTPTWEFSNIEEEQDIRNSSFSPILTYSQAQGEQLNSYQIILYDALHNKISSTDVIYNTSGELTALFTGLQDNQTYYFRATGETINHMLLDTGYVKVNIDYIQPVIFDVVDVENLSSQGAIRISSNIQSVVGRSDYALEYIDGKVVLTQDEVNVIFDEAFNIDTDFTIQINGQGFNPNSVILELRNNRSGVIQVLYKQCKVRGSSTDKVFVCLKAESAGVMSYYISNIIDVPLETDNINIWIRRVNNLYEIVILKTT